MTAPNTWDISWVYDRYGNRTQQTETGGTLAVTNQSLTLNNNNQLTGGFFYDASGNMTDDGVTHNYVYDAEDRFVKLGTTVANTYDGQSLRVEKVTGGSTTVYVFSGVQVIAEYSPTASTAAPSKEYLYSGGQLLATLDASHNPTYRNPDLLSARLFTNASGNSVGTQGHLPFGESWYSTGTVDKWKFTSYERDTDTNLDYARMRFNSGRLARFLTPDPYSGSVDVGNPQSWNRYAYVTNDPLNLTDALGLCGETNGICDTQTVNVTATYPPSLETVAPIVIIDGSIRAMPMQSTGQWFRTLRLANSRVVVKGRKNLCLLQRARLLTQAGLSFVVAEGKIVGVVALAGAEPVTGGASTAGVIYLGWSASGNLVAGGSQFVGAVSGKIQEADESATVATTMTSLTGPPVLVATGGNMEAASQASAWEALWTTGFNGGKTGALFDEGASVLQKIAEGHETLQSILDALGVAPGACK